MQHTKDSLGYQKEDVKPVAGQPIFDYFSESRPLPGVYPARREACLVKVAAVQHAQSAQTKTRLKALAAIKAETGTIRASKHSHHIKYNTWRGWRACLAA